MSLNETRPLIIPSITHVDLAMLINATDVSETVFQSLIGKLKKYFLLLFLFFFSFPKTIIELVLMRVRVKKCKQEFSRKKIECQIHNLRKVIFFFFSLSIIVFLISCTELVCYLKMAKYFSD